MKPVRKIGLWIFCSFSILIAGQQEQAGVFYHEITVISRGDSVLALGPVYLFSGTLEIRAGDFLFKPSQYSIDDRGILYFHTPPDSGTELRIRYKQLQVSIPSLYRHFSAADTMETDSLSAEDKSPSIKTMPAAEQEDYEMSAALEKSGSIFRGITLGTDQGMRLQSGLRLQVSGQVAPGVDVTASLTDQNTPIQPEGNTQTLQEIDKVFINITAGSLKATLGDFVFDTGPSGFGTYSRKLQGVMGSVEAQRGSVTLIGAASRGQFTTNYFQGEESNQGPYQLTGGQGQREIIVLAGTERVWIDGESMVRGEDNDYTIEYGTGQITFTRNRLITGDSRITVDFEYSDLKFQKSIYGAAAESRFLNDRFRFRTILLRESDDKDNPLDAVLTEEYKKILADAGDHADSAVTSGARYVGPGNGTYRQIEVDGITVYQYAGNDGDMAVRFTYAGEGLGDYSFQGYGIYRYEGPGKGNYMSSMFLPMARTHQTVTLQSEFRIEKDVTLAGEFGLSDLDLNQYSSKDDEENTDQALQAELTIARKPVHLVGKNLGNLSFSGNIRRVGGLFRSLGRVADVEYGRKWGTSEGIFWGENIWEVRSTYSPSETMTLRSEFGDFRRGDFSSQRRVVNAELHTRRFPKIQYQAEWVRTGEQDQDGIWIRQNGQIQTALGCWTPSVRYEGEHRREEKADTVQTGFLFDEWTGSLAFRRGMASGFIEESLRKNQKYETGDLVRESSAKIDKIQFGLSPGRQFDCSFMFTHRDRDYTDPASEDQRADLADMKIRFGPENRVLDGQINYQFSSTRVSEMVRDTVQLETGLGNYRYDAMLDELVPDPDGDLLVRMVQTGKFTPVNDLKAGTEISLDGSRIWKKPTGWQSAAASLRSRTLFRTERRDSERNFSKVNRTALHPDWGKDSTTVMAMISLQQDLELQPRGSRFSMRLRYKKNDSENNQLMNENLTRRITEKGVRIKGQFMQSTGILTEYVFRQDKKTYVTRTSSDRDISVHDGLIECSFRPTQPLEVALKGQIRLARNGVSTKAEAFSLFWIPRMSYAFRGRGNIRVELEFGEVSSDPETTAIPYEMLNGDQPGRTFRCNVLMTYRLSGHVTSTLSYRARQEPWRDSLYQTGQVEVRAFF